MAKQLVNNVFIIISFIFLIKIGSIFKLRFAPKKLGWISKINPCVHVCACVYTLSVTLPQAQELDGYSYGAPPPDTQLKPGGLEAVEAEVEAGSGGGGGGGGHAHGDGSDPLAWLRDAIPGILSDLVRLLLFRSDGHSRPAQTVYCTYWGILVGLVMDQFY